MKSVELSRRPDCDIHKYLKQQVGVPALYDGPTTAGHHGYMCQDCMDEVGYPDSSITYKLEVTGE